jgi:hypothetical protein
MLSMWTAMDARITLQWHRSPLHPVLRHNNLVLPNLKHMRKLLLHNQLTGNHRPPMANNLRQLTLNSPCTLKLLLRNQLTANLKHMRSRQLSLVTPHTDKCSHGRSGKGGREKKEKQKRGEREGGTRSSKKQEAKRMHAADSCGVPLYYT